MISPTPDHRPSLVLELAHRDGWMFCLACQQPWPCEESRGEH